MRARGRLERGVRERERERERVQRERREEAQREDEMRERERRREQERRREREQEEEEMRRERLTFYQTPFIQTLFFISGGDQRPLGMHLNLYTGLPLHSDCVIFQGNKLMVLLRHYSLFVSFHLVSLLSATALTAEVAMGKRERNIFPVY